MEVSLTVISLVVVFLCFCSFALGVGVSFFFMARDKTLVRVSESHTVVDRDYLEQMQTALKQRRGSRRYDGQVMIGDEDDGA